MRIRRASLCAVLVAGTLAAGARANVGVLPLAIGSVDSGKAAELQASLEVELGDVLKRRYVKAAATRACGATFSDECALEVAKASKPPLDEVALLRVDGTPSGGYVVDISVRETGEGRRVFHESVVQQPTDGPGVVGAALRRAFEPRDWAGRIVVGDAPPDAEVLLDGLRITGPTVVRVGAHQVRVNTADGQARLFDVDVRHGEVSTVSFEVPRVAATPSVLPALILGAVTVAGTGVAATLGGISSWQCCWGTQEGAVDGVPYTRTLYEFVVYQARTAAPPPDVDPNDESWETGYGTAPGDGDTAASKLAQRALLHADLAAYQSLMASNGFAAVVAGTVAVAAGVGAVLAWPSVPDEAAAAP